MLVQYAVENYKSIKDEIVINFRAGKKFNKSDWTTSFEDKSSNFYKCIGLFGPNASGKSNILESFNFALRFIGKTISRKDNAKIAVEPFAFSEGYRNKPSFFEFIFYIDSIKYVYGFSVNNTKVLEEYLMAYFTNKPKTLFERSEGDIYDFRGNDVKLQTDISLKTNSNRLYMPVAAEWGYEKIKPVMRWFDSLNKQYEKFNASAEMISEICKDEQRKALFIRELQKADFNISDIYVRNRHFEKNEKDFMDKIFALIDEDFSVPEERADIRVVHKNNNGELMDISLNDDSAGTYALIWNIAEIMYVGQYGGFMVEDELGKEYHTLLTEHFLSMIKSEEINPKDAQLFFSSHDVRILNTLNSDQIYLVDKADDGSTYVKLLDDFDIRTSNVELGYLKGRFGGIPYVGR